MTLAAPEAGARLPAHATPTAGVKQQSGGMQGTWQRTQTRQRHSTGEPGAVWFGAAVLLRKGEVGAEHEMERVLHEDTVTGS